MTSPQRPAQCLAPCRCLVNETETDGQTDTPWQHTPCVLVAQSCLTLHDRMDYSPPGSSVQRISQERILEWVAVFFSRGSSSCRDQTSISCIGRWTLTTEPPEKPGKYLLKMHDQAQLPGSESLGWGPRIRILTSFPHSLYLKKNFLWAILKVFTEFVIILLLFYVLFFGLKACGTLACRPRIVSAPYALEGKVLTTGPPGKSLPHDSYVLNLWV